MRGEGMHGTETRSPDPNPSRRRNHTSDHPEEKPPLITHNTKKPPSPTSGCFDASKPPNQKIQAGQPLPKTVLTNRAPSGMQRFPACCDSELASPHSWLARVGRLTAREGTDSSPGSVRFRLAALLSPGGLSTSRKTYHAARSMQGGERLRDSASLLVLAVGCTAAQRTRIRETVVAGR